MKERTGILRSRYIGAAFAALFLLIAGINAASVFISGRNLQSPEGIEKEVSDFAVVVIPFGRYEEVRVPDGEKKIAEGENILDYFTDGRFRPPSDGSVIRPGSEPFCMMDFDDGIALVNKDKPSDNDPFTSEFIIPMTKRWYYRRDDTKWMERYEWGFVNEERKEICDYIFSGAFPTDNRYAAVAVSDMWGVIRFK